MVAQQLVGWGALIIKMRKLMLLILMGMFLVSLASAESIGTWKQDDCVDLIQTAVNASYVKISSITLPDSTQMLTAEVTMEKTGNYYNYTFCNTTNLGTYQVSGYGDELNIEQVWAYTFDVTVNGQTFSTGQGILLLGGIFVILFISLMLFMVSISTKFIPVKLFLVGLGSVFSMFALGISLTLFKVLLASLTETTEVFSRIYVLLAVLLFVGVIGFLIFTVVRAITSFAKMKNYNEDDDEDDD